MLVSMFDRRSVIGGMSALGAALALPASSASAAAGAKPPRLRPGDSVGLVAPATFSDDVVEIEAIKNTIAGMGLVPKVGQHVLARYGYLAGTDAQRAADVNTMFADKDVRAL